MHMDMDAFFASIEQLDNPQLRGRPVVVGGEHRGVVSTCSYEARRFGIRSAMPVAEARRRCPHAVYIRPRMQRYAEMSALVRETIARFSPRVEMASVDEAYLDATGLERLFGPVEAMGYSLKEAVKTATGGLTCSVGIAPVKFLAKIASEQRKPDGLFLLAPEAVPAFLAALPVTAVPGVGRHFAAELASMGVKNCADVSRYGADFWQRRYGKAGAVLWARAHGEDPREVVPWSPPKSESAEVTLDEDTLDRELLRTWLLRHAERVGASLRRQGLAGRTVTLKIKYADFRQITRQVTLDRRVCSTESIYETACAILDRLELAGRVRLVGVGVSGFEAGAPAQLSLMPEKAAAGEEEKKRDKLNMAVDALRSRYGTKAVVRGRLFEGGSGDHEAEAIQAERAEAHRIRERR
ncbi:DNA polymerase IV [uncultured Mailhella sp.]|uniref:DNA polymerase IV n=1 Tax=uncultured Mailhella sp. TaxID=1981031 RepID=UPI0025EC0F4C|nr:DNA polymerase IV [uncultured Mailhella sp.]